MEKRDVAKTLQDMSEVAAKEGWLWKRSIGRSVLFGSRNWKLRYFISTISGIRYFAQEPFDSPKFEVSWATVTHVYRSCGPEVDADAADRTKFYFGLRFTIGDDEKLLLLRSDSDRERIAWVAHFEMMLAEFQRITDIINEEDEGGDYEVGEDLRGGGAKSGAGIFESINRKLRNMVSLEKQRYQKDGLDLDLAYILPNVIAMGYPSEGKEAVYRNPMDQVVSFFSRYHAGAFKIYNLCSERAYPPSRFQGSFARFPFDDHNPPPLELLLPCVDDIHEYLLQAVAQCNGASAPVNGAAQSSEQQQQQQPQPQQSPVGGSVQPPCALEGPELLDCDLEAFQRTPANVVAIHCKAGKGRTGLVVCCYLLFSGACPDAASALRVFGDRRTKDGKGVQIPSQKRYLTYFDSLLRDYSGVCPPAPQLLFKSVTLSSTPRFDPDGGSDPYVMIHRRSAEHQHVPQGHAEGSFHNPLELVYDSRRGFPVSHIVKQRDVEIPLNFKVDADEFRVTIMDADPLGKDDKMCCFWVHSAFLPLEGRYTMMKHEIDDAVKDKKNSYFTEDFSITLNYEILSALVTHPNPAARAAQEHIRRKGGAFRIPAKHPSARIEPATRSSNTAAAAAAAAPDTNDEPPPSAVLNDDEL